MKRSICLRTPASNKKAPYQRSRQASPQIAAGVVYAYTTPLQLLRVCAALLLRHIDWPQFRLWFALQEARIRARFPGAGTVCQEAAKLMGARWNVLRVARGERELVAAGVGSGDGAVPSISVELEARLGSMAAQLGHDNVGSEIRIPRWHVCWIVGLKMPATAIAATWTWHILRACLDKRAKDSWWQEYRAEPDHRGCASAAKITTVFGISGRRVGSARTRLEADGLFRSIETEPYVSRWYGKWVSVMPIRNAETLVDAGRGGKMQSSVPHYVQPKTLLNSKPSGRKRPGRFQRNTPPKWQRIRRCDLGDPRRHLDLHHSAVTAGVITASIPDAVMFFAAVARAKRCGKHNRAGFLRRLIEVPQYKTFLADVDYQIGEELLKEAAAAGDAPDPALEGGRGDEGLAADWRYVAAICQSLVEFGIPLDDAWSAIQEDSLATKQLDGWDESRWDGVLAWGQARGYLADIVATAGQAV